MTQTDTRQKWLATWSYVKHAGLPKSCKALYSVAFLYSACIRPLSVTAEEEEQEKAQAAVKAEKAKKEKQKNKKSKQKVTASGIWQEVYNIRSRATFYILLLLGLLNKHTSL